MPIDPTFSPTKIVSFNVYILFKVVLNIDEIDLNVTANVLGTF